MQVIVALENVIKTFTFPDETAIETHPRFPGFIQVTQMDTGRHSWFNTAYVIAIIPGTKAGG